MYDPAVLLMPGLLLVLMLGGIFLLYVRYKIATVIIVAGAPLAVYLLIFARLESVWWIVIIAADLMLLIASLLIGMVKLVEIAEETHKDQQQMLTALMGLLLDPNDPPKR